MKIIKNWINYYKEGFSKSLKETNEFEFWKKNNRKQMKGKEHIFAWPELNRIMIWSIKRTKDDIDIIKIKQSNKNCQSFKLVKEMIFWDSKYTILELYIILQLESSS